MIQAFVLVAVALESPAPRDQRSQKTRQIGI